MFWQGYLPKSIFVTIGPLTIHWYGLILVLAILIGFWYALKSINRPNIKLEQLDSLFFYLIIFGLIGARLGHVLFFNWSYFSNNWLEVFKIWQGGLSILGTIITELIVLWFWSKKNNINFWQMADWLAPALALGQAIGRWGNYFNQELYGLPTKGWWGIPVAPENRLFGFEQYAFFHPTFFYESILNLILFILLWRLIRFYKNSPGVISLYYLAGYAMIRFVLEFVRIDPAPIIFGLRLPQIYSLVLIVLVLGVFYLRFRPLPELKK